MIKEQQVLDDLVMAAMQKGNDPAVDALLAGIRNCDIEILRGSAENFNLLFQEWDDSVASSDTKAEVCLALAELSVLDSAIFRAALNDAGRRLLPPYISSGAVAKAIGARDTGLAVNSVASRIKKLQKLKTNAYIYQTESQCWGRMSNLDKVTATIAVNTFTTNSKISIPLSTALSGCLFFEQHIDMTNLIAANAANIKSSAYCREVLAKHTLGGISEEKAKALLEKMYIPTLFTAETFEQWWNNTAPAAKTGNGRSIEDARSILELYTLMGGIENEAELKLNAASAEKLAKLFSRIRPNMPSKDQAILAETLSALAKSNEEELLKTMFAPIRGKVPFFPQDINENVQLKNLEIWGRLAVKFLAGFIKAAECVYTRYELAKLFTLLPLRCMTPMMEFLTVNDISDAIFATEKVSCDVLLFIWKNKVKFAELKEYVNMQNVSRTLSAEELPKEWAAAQRELKKLLFDKPDFQKLILENAGENVSALIYAVQKIRNMQVSECQSLLVKLSRISEALKNKLESGEGRKVLGGMDEDQADDSVLMTSLASYKRLAEELDELVRVKIPENTKAVETARAFGDLSENAEYDAAKLQRSILRKRRSELENQLATVQVVDFAELKPNMVSVAIATQVDLETKDGKSLSYSIVGVFDGKPEANQIAYNTALGKALLGKKVGDSVVLPSGDNCKVTKIAGFDSELIRSLSAEI